MYYYWVGVSLEMNGLVLLGCSREIDAMNAPHNLFKRKNGVQNY